MGHVGYVIAVFCIIHQQEIFDDLISDHTAPSGSAEECMLTSGAFTHDHDEITLGRNTSGESQRVEPTALLVEPRVMLSQPPFPVADPPGPPLKLRRKTVEYVMTSTKPLKWKSFPYRGLGK
jgi:hypothetical protein